MTLDLSQQRKVKVPREVFVQWIESAIRQVGQAQRVNMEIWRTFQKCGLDSDDREQLLFEQYLHSLSSEALYNALIQGQTALDL